VESLPLVVGKIQRFALIDALDAGQLSAIRIANKEPDVVHTASVDETSADSSIDLATGSTAERLLKICNQHVDPERVDITDLFEYPCVDELAGFLDETVAA